MKETLYQKLRASELYTQEELYWLLDNIGNPEADIRDQLVYASFCHALLDGLVTVKVFTWLAEQIMVQNLLFYQIEETGIPTLTRSFTALLAALLIELDCEEDSPYTAFPIQSFPKLPQKSIYVGLTIKISYYHLHGFKSERTAQSRGKRQHPSHLFVLN